MAKYSANMQGVGLSTTADFHSLFTTATGQGSVLRIFEIWLSGEAGAPAVNRIAVNRSTGGTLGATVQTPEKLDPASVAALFTIAGSATAVSIGTAPTLATNDILSPTFNAFGGTVRWVAPPDSEIVVGSQGAVAPFSFRSRSGTSNISGHILIEER